MKFDQFNQMFFSFSAFNVMISKKIAMLTGTGFVSFTYIFLAPGIYAW
jgi:hypothetical protein